MRIARIDVFAHELTYAGGDAFTLSRDRVQGDESSTLVRITTDDGHAGWGEACPLTGTYLPSFTGGVRAALETLAPALLGADPRNLAGVNARMDATLLGQPGAKSPLDIACWDLLGQACGLPVATLLGGRLTDALPLYVAVPLGSPQETRDRVADGWARGFRRFQLKVGAEPRRDHAAVLAALDVTGDQGLVIADANGGWSLADALRAAHLMADLPVQLEQPCRTFAECLHVRRATGLPMVYDELVTDAASLISAVQDGGASAVNVKLAKVGGLTGARRMRDLAVALGAQLTLEDTWGGDIATAAISHIAAATPAASLLSVCFVNDAVAEHVAGHAPRSDGGTGSAPEGPGLGICVDTTSLREPVMTFT